MESVAVVPDLRHRTLLLCDDVPAMLRTAHQILVKRIPGLEVLTARDGAEGLALARERVVDALVTDFHMPVMDGLTLALRMRRERPEMGIAIMTAYTDLPLTPEAFGAVGVDLLLRKPLDPIAFSQVARYLLRTPAPTRASVRASQALFVAGADEGGALDGPAVKWCVNNHPNPPPGRFCSMCGKPLSDLPHARPYHPRDAELSRAVEFGQTLSDAGDAALYGRGLALMRRRVALESGLLTPEAADTRA